jgi:hypothetical protein
VLVLAALLCFGAAPAMGQEHDLPSWLRPLHHAGEMPDYVVDVLTPRLGPLVLPPPPLETEGYLTLHHSPRAPDYVGAIQPAARAVPIPPAPAGQPPAVVRGLYMNGWIFGSSRFYDFFNDTATTEIYTLVIDVKDATGYITYRSSVPTAQQIGATELVRVADPRGRLALLHERGIHPIARIVVARDPLLAKRKTAWAIHDSSGALWRDGLGEPWVDAHNDSVWHYAAALAEEAVLMGFREIQFDYVRFPDEPPERLGRTVYPAKRPGESRRAAIRRNVGILGDRVRRAGVPFTLDVFGLTTSARGDLGIGQVWEDLSGAADVILPMVYPSHYRRGSFGLPNPNREPYTVIRRAMEEAVERNRGLSNPAKIRPYLQAFTIYRVRYGPEEIMEQIRAVEEVGLTDWVLWNARGVYPPDALRPEGRSQGASPASTVSVPGDADSLTSPAVSSQQGPKR